MGRIVRAVLSLCALLCGAQGRELRDTSRTSQLAQPRELRELPGVPPDAPGTRPAPADAGKAEPEEAVIYSEVIDVEISSEQFFDIFLTSLVALMILITFWELLIGPTPLGQVVPTAAFSLFLGMCFAYVMRTLNLSEPEREMMKFSNRIFLFVLLPPIIYESTFMMDRKLFFHNIRTIMMIVVPGVILSTAMIGMVIYWAGSAGAFTHDGRTPLDFSSPLEPMLFGSLISATDPVATLAILSTISIPRVTFVLIFGESLLNDAVSIVLYRVLKARGASTFSWAMLPIVVGDFVAISVGSVLVGCGIGLLSAYMHRRLTERTFHSPSGEMTSIILFGYIAYTLAESVGLSGITALVVAGICQRSYTFYSVSHEAQHGSHYVLELISSKAEQFVFLYLGINVFLVSGDAARQHHHRVWDVHLAGFAAFVLLVCLLSRLAMLLLCCSVANLWRAPSRQIKRAEMLLMWWAGLRGAMAFALAKDLNNEVLVSLTIAVVLFTTFVCGCSTSLVVSKLGLTQGPKEPADKPHGREQEHAGGVELLPPGAHSSAAQFGSPAAGGGWLGEATPPPPPTMSRRQSAAVLVASTRRQRFWDRFDRRWMRPLFGGPGAHLAHAQGSQLSEKLAVPLSRQRSVSITAAQPSYGTGADETGARRSSLPVQQPEHIRHLAQLGAPSLTPSEGREERATCILDVEDEQYSSDEEQPLVLLYEEQPIQEGDEEAEIGYSDVPSHLRLAPREPHELERTPDTLSEDGSMARSTVPPGRRGAGVETPATQDKAARGPHAPLL